MKSSRLLLLVAALALFATGMIALWKLLDTAPDRTASTARKSDAAAPAEPATKHELAAPAPETVAAPMEVARRDSAPAFTGADQNFDLTSAHEVAGRVVLPANAPADETLRVWVVDLHGDDAVGRVFFGRGDDPAGVLIGLAEQSGARWAHRPVAADGSFRVPAPADATLVKVVLDGRYLYLDEETQVELPRTEPPLALGAKLGAWIVARCTPPKTASAEDRAALGQAFVAGCEMGGRRGGRGVRRSVPIAADWTFEMRGIAPVPNCQIVVDPERFVRATDKEVKLEAGRKVEREYDLAAGARVSGRVLGGADAPVPGATVTMERGKSAGRFGDMAAMMVGVEPRQAETDEQGRFTLHGLEPATVRIVATREGWVRAQSDELALADGAVVEGLELRLDAGASVAGTVAFADGATAAKAAVTLRKTAQEGAGNQRFLGGGGEHTTTCDDEGRFRFTGLEGGPFELHALLSQPFANAGVSKEEDASASPSRPTRAIGPGGSMRSTRAAGPRGRMRRSFAASDAAELLAPGERQGARVFVAQLADVAAGREDARLVLADPPGLRGRVVDAAGAPVQRFSITLEPDWEDRSPLDTSLHAEGYDSADGRFVLEGVPAGKWLVGAASEGAVQAGEKPTVELPAKDEVVVTLSRSGTIAGVVLDPLGAPVPNAHVQRRSQGDTNPFAGLGMSDVECDEQGAFLLRDLPPGAYELIASAEQWAKGEPLPITVAGGETREGVSLLLRRGGTLEGEVFDAKGEHVSGRSVQLFTMAGDMRQSSVGADGRFREEHLTPGTYQVMLQPDMGQIEKMANQAGEDADPSAFLAQMKMTSAEIKDGEVTHVVLGAPPKAPVRVHGRITRGTNAVTKGTLVVLNEGGALMQNMKFGKVTPDGRYEVTLDQPGDVVLVYAQEMGRNDGVEFYLSVPEAADWEHDLALPQCGLRGTVRGPEGKPLPNVTVDFARTDGPTSVMMFGGGNTRTTDDAGRYSIDDLNPGMYSVAAGGASVGQFGFGDSSSFGRVVRGGLRLESDKVLEGVDLKLEMAGTITGVVRDSQGKAVSGATIYARTKDGELVHRFGVVNSDAAGNYTYKGLGSGTYTLSARTKALAAKDGAAVTLGDGESAACDLVVETGTILRVTITDKNDKAVRASVSIQDERGNEVSGMLAMDAMMEMMSQGISTTERKFGPLAPGKYVVTATTPDGKTVKKPVTLSGQEERKLRIRPE
ncbi:MAG: carboxypeptidase regulatory-like domain-containing protein [Planctomycetes bacterium]|nr:carboxypeptidase regulatory-like domain-containing protein [Planctomycetota bacterium]